MIRYHLLGASWALLALILAMTGFAFEAGLATIVTYYHAKNGPEA